MRVARLFLRFNHRRSRKREILLAVEFRSFSRATRVHAAATFLWATALEASQMQQHRWNGIRRAKWIPATNLTGGGSERNYSVIALGFFVLNRLRWISPPGTPEEDRSIRGNLPLVALAYLASGKRALERWLRPRIADFLSGRRTPRGGRNSASFSEPPKTN